MYKVYYTHEDDQENLYSLNPADTDLSVAKDNANRLSNDNTVNNIFIVNCSDKTDIIKVIGTISSAVWLDQNYPGWF